ncbi:hypothetical protein FKM82_014072 [Ascaphus truei]
MSQEGNNQDLKNYRLIILQPITLFLLPNWLQQIHTWPNPREQAGFCSGYNTIDPIQLVQDVIWEVIKMIYHSSSGLPKKKPKLIVNTSIILNVLRRHC